MERLGQPPVLHFSGSGTTSSDKNALFPVFLPLLSIKFVHIHTFPVFLSIIALVETAPLCSSLRS